MFSETHSVQIVQISAYSTEWIGLSEIFGKKTKKKINK